MLMNGGKERTTKEFRALVEKAGLEVVRIWKSEISSQCIVEANVKAVT